VEWAGHFTVTARIQLSASLSYVSLAAVTYLSARVETVGLTETEKASSSFRSTEKLVMEKSASR